MVHTDRHLDFELFISFLCDRQATNLITAINSSTQLFTYCIPSREAVLKFYDEVFIDYSTYYWNNKGKSVTETQNETNGGPTNAFVGFEKQISLIRSTLQNLMTKYETMTDDTRVDVSSSQSAWSQGKKEHFQNQVTSWASDLLIYLNANHSETSVKIATEMTKTNTKMFLTRQIELWTDSPVNKLLLDIILESHHDIYQLFKRFATTSQNCDWFFAHALLEISKQSNRGRNFTTCMEYVIGRSCDINSLTYILAYISDNNPKAMPKFPKSNIPLNLDLLSQLIVDKLCAAILDIDSIAQLIKLCCSSLEQVDHTRIRIGTKHKLCMSLATSFFLLLEMNGERFPEILSYTRVSLTCMSLLRQSEIASHILCRALLERSLVYGHLFNVDFKPHLWSTYLNSDTSSLQVDDIKLSKEILKVSVGHRFRRLPNHPPDRALSTNKMTKKVKLENGDIPSNGDIPDRQSINSYLLIEAFKSSINNIDSFADLFVEFHCPVMFDKNLWPPDENLRVINETNLGILRRFEQVPPFWDLYELIGKAECLKNCLVLVKALLAAHIAMWASATAKSFPDKLISTTRLIPPLADSGLVPRAFGLTVEVLPNLSPNEVYAVLSDIWNYLKDTVHLPKSEESALQDDVMARAKMYLTRLRIFMCHHMPGSIYVKIFKELYRPAPKTIPT